MSLSPATHIKGTSLRMITMPCLCGRVVSLIVTGNNNADGKGLCKCGRHLTAHYRRRYG